MRRKARECALQVLYLLEATLPVISTEPDAKKERAPLSTAASAVDDALHNFFANFEAPPKGQRFASTLVRGVVTHSEELDALIGRHADTWRVERMAMVDRNVLRLAAFELKDDPNVPTRVILDEAVELSKRFGSQQSSAFVNGIIDGVARELRQVGAA